MFTRHQALVTTSAAPLFWRQPSRLPAGLWSVMLTPFRADRSIDWPAFDALTEWYPANGAVCLFACCQSSEVWQLTAAERLEVTARVVKITSQVTARLEPDRPWRQRVEAILAAAPARFSQRHHV